MAEITRTEVRTEKQTMSRIGGSSEPTISVQVTTEVRSIYGRVDASVVRDFVATLDQIEAPGTAKIDAQKVDGRFVELMATWTSKQRAPDVAAAAAAADVAAAVDRRD